MNEKINTVAVDRTLMSRLAALMVIAGLFLFTTGYFLGKKQGIHEFLKTFEHESFADQIYTALHNLYPLERYTYDLPVEQIEQETQPLVFPAAATESTDDATPKAGFYANVIGFQTRKAAEHFKERLRKKAIEVFIKERQSTTTKGKKIVWYQISTPVYADKAALATAIEQIKKVENIKEISMRTV